MTEAWGFLWLGILLAINAFFVGAEFAVIAARRSQIEPLVAQGKRTARPALWAIENATLMLATAQLGITVCSLLILYVSEPAVHAVTESALHATGWSASTISVIAFFVALLLVTFLHVVLGELVPKNASFSAPDRALLVLAPALISVATVLRPLIYLLNVVANGVLRLFKVTPRAEASSVFTLDQVATIVSHSTEEGTLEDLSGTISATIEFTAKKARDIQVPVAKLVSLPESATVADLETAVAKHGFSRYVITDSLGAPVGYLHLKDVLTLDQDADSTGTSEGPIKSKRVRQFENVTEQTDLEDALAQMQKSGVHLARVIDERGHVTGVLFLEDIIEELVGEVHDATRRQ